jgi:glucose/arabinose dehydrogenase
MPSKRRILLGIASLAVTGYMGWTTLGPTPFPTTEINLQRTQPATPTARPAERVVPSPVPRPPTVSPADPEVVAIGSGAEQRLTFIDTATNTVAGTVDVGIPAQRVTLAPGGQTAWVFSTRAADSDYAIVDLVKRTHQQSRRLRNNPDAVAFSTDGRRAYVTLGGANDSPPQPSSVVFVDVSNGSEFGHVDLGQQSPGVQIQRRLDAIAVAPGPAGDVVYAAGRASGTVWAIDGGSGALLQQIETGGGPIALLASTPNHRVYAIDDTTNEVVAIDTTNQTIANRLSLPGAPSGAALAPNGTLYVTGADAGQLWPVDLTNWRRGAPVSVGSRPSGVAVTLDGRRAYVPLAASGSVAIVDLTSNRVSSTIATGNDPAAAVVARGSGAAGANASPAPTAAPHPTSTPTLVATATPLPQGSQVPDHLSSGAMSEPFMPADSPVGIAFAPDGTLFYNELHSGKIRIVHNGKLLPDPFYQFTVSGEPEAGLIGLALDPDFDSNHYVYVFYTSVPDGQDNGGPNGPNQVVRLTDVANKGTDLTPILPDLPSGPIHNSGTLRFGPDGKLYVSIGDNDHGANAQDLSTLAGKILRVNPEGTIPGDNPFIGQPGKQGAIWAYGFRNPFSFDFDPVRHGMLATENGPGDNDELDFIQPGGNYGWPPTGYKYTPGVVDPLAVMNPTISPTGSTFYTGDQMPEWKNDWFYCNYHQGQLRRLHLAPESRDRVVFDEVVKNGCGFNVANAPDGALYYTDAKGIYRIRNIDAANSIPIPVLGSASDAGTAPTPTAEALPAGTRAEDRDVNVSLNEWKLQPSRSRVPSGQISFLAEDTGQTQHALRLVGQGIDVRTDAFGPGDSSRLQLQLQPGQYRLVCPIPGHEQQGMSATFTVVGS